MKIIIVSKGNLTLELSEGQGKLLPNIKMQSGGLSCFPLARKGFTVISQTQISYIYIYQFMSNALIM